MLVACRSVCECECEKNSKPVVRESECPSSKANARRQLLVARTMQSSSPSMRGPHANVDELLAEDFAIGTSACCITLSTPDVKCLNCC